MKGVTMKAGDVERLSAGQKECLRLVHQGYEGKEIARHLGISPHAVVERLRAARRISGLATSREAARWLAAHEGPEHYNRSVHNPSGIAEAGDQGRTGAAILNGSARTSASATLLEEEQADYLVGQSHSRTVFVWPFPKRERPHNDLTTVQTLINVTILTIGLALAALVAITLVDQLSRLRLG